MAHQGVEQSAPFYCVDYFARCAQVLLQLACTLPVCRRALLHSVRSGRCGFSWSCRLRQPAARRKNLRTSRKKSIRDAAHSFSSLLKASCQGTNIGDMRVGIRRWGGPFSLRPTFAQVEIDGRKLVVGNSSHIDNICPRRARFRRDGLKGESPMASPRRSDRRGSSDRGNRVPD